MFFKSFKYIFSPLKTLDVIVFHIFLRFPPPPRSGNAFSVLDRLFIFAKWTKKWRSFYRILFENEEISFADL